VRSAKPLDRPVLLERSNGKRGQVHTDVHLPRVAVGRRLKTKTKRDARVSSNDIFPVAGIGCSAGGVEALQFFFQNMPPDSGMAFIVVTHLARDYHSLLPEIVARHARMPVTAALDGQTIEPNTVYICPPNHILRVEKRTLQLTPRLSDQQHKPIDSHHVRRHLEKSRREKKEPPILVSHQSG
jgi:chemotaxis response regulator CheB